MYPYLSPICHPFACKTPIWITVGTLKALHDDGITLATGKKGVEGNKVELWGKEGATHDIFLMDKLGGFEKAAEKLTLRAVDFLKENRLKNSLMPSAYRIRVRSGWAKICA